MFDIISYESKYHPDFKRLNLEWLEHYQLTETLDLKILDNPQQYILDGGGCLFLAIDGAKVIGTTGLAKEHEGVYELVKMAVDPQYRGRGIGKQLLDRCLEEARMYNAKKVFLFSNSQLLVALKLYEQYGFRHIDASDSPMLTADVKMELNLTAPNS